MTATAETFCQAVTAHPPSNSCTVSVGFLFLKLQRFPTIPNARGKVYQHSGHLGTCQELQQGREQVQGEQSRAEEEIIRWGGQRGNVSVKPGRVPAVSSCTTSPVGHSPVRLLSSHRHSWTRKGCCCRKHCRMRNRAMSRRPSWPCPWQSVCASRLLRHRSTGHTSCDTGTHQSR